MDRQKRPRDNNWGGNTYSVNDLGTQIGLVIEPGMVDIDYDWPEVRAIVTDGEYDTLTWGRHGKVTHSVYRCDLDAPVTFKLSKHAKGAPMLEGDHAYTILELRTSSKGEAYQAMIPESVHPDGDQLQWINDNLPAERDADTILQHAGMFAGLAVLIRFYPGEGMRDDFALALTGCMVRAGWDEQRVEQFMTYLCRATGDNEIKMRSQKARRTLKRLEAGKADDNRRWQSSDHAVTECVRPR